MALTRTAMEKSPAVAWIVKKPESTRVNKRGPYHLAFVWSPMYAVREQQPLLSKCLYRGRGGTGPLKRLEKHP